MDAIQRKGSERRQDRRGEPATIYDYSMSQKILKNGMYIYQCQVFGILAYCLLYRLIILVNAAVD